MSDSSDNNSTSTTEGTFSPFKKGERISPNWSFKFVGPPQTFEAGTLFAPARISTPSGRNFAALHLILSDLSFARDCLTAADKFGLPDSNDLSSKALIFSGVVAYARPFMTGVLEIRLAPAFFDEAKGFNAECHEYLINLRSKHVAHSVNEFERCTAIAILAAKPGEKWRNGNAIGTIEQRDIGLNQTMVQVSIAHITAMIAFLSELIERKRTELCAEFSTHFEAGGKWDMAPILTLSDRTKVDKARKK